MPQKNNVFLIIIIIQDLDLQSGKGPFKYYVSMFLASVHVRFPLATYVKDILSRSTKTHNNTVID